MFNYSLNNYKYNANVYYPQLILNYLIDMRKLKAKNIKFNNKPRKH